MDIHKDIDLMDCPYCGGAGLLDDGNGWSFSVRCMDCGSETADFKYTGESDRLEAAKDAAMVWNMGKVVRSDIGE